MKLDLLTNATVVDDAIRFVASAPTHIRALKIQIGEDEEYEDCRKEYKILNADHTL
jgi:hypothetical protein